MISSSILFTGDSITDKSHGYVHKNYIDYVAEQLGCNTINDGKSGTGLLMPAGGNVGILQRIDSWHTYPDFDSVVVMGNMNDYALWSIGAFPVGSIHDAPYGTSNPVATQCSIVKATIEKILSTYPNKSLLWIVSTPRAASWPGFVSQKMWGVDGPWHTYAEAIKECCAHYGVPCLDLYHESSLRPWLNTTAYSGTDVIHPNDEGHKIISSKIVEFINQYA